MITKQERLNARIFIVDDQPANTMLLEKTLKQAGYSQVCSTNDSRQAAPIYMEFQPDLVLLDLKMPYMDGFQVMEQLNAFEENSYAPVLVLTAQADENNQLRALHSGAKDFLGKPFSSSEVLARINNMLEVRLLNKNLEQKVQERTKELNETRLEIIRRLGHAAEYRDNETGMHVIRMSHYSVIIARAAGLDKEECERILNASPMHDLGKIGVPDSILLKPDKLDEHEWKMMKAHPGIGAKILSGSHSDLLKMAETIALTHQEKWDGSGYPKGLKGEEIPLFGRIVALADVFDALTTERPYKKAWPVEKAVALIEEESGKHFDPQLVAIFKDILPEILEIKEKFAEK